MSEQDEWLREAIRGLHKRLDRIEEQQQKRLDEIERRLSGLERWRAYLVGAWTALAAGVALVLGGRGHQ